MPSNNVYGTLYNADSVALSGGMIVRASANKRVVRALADSDANVLGLVGVNASGIVGVGGPLNVVSAAVQVPVLCETGLTLTAGETLFVSDTVPGRATNVEPLVSAAIGTVTDVGSYATTGLVIAAITALGAGAGGGGSGSGSILARLATTTDDTLAGLAARDGITPIAGDIVLVNFQTAPAENGLYTAAAGAWARATAFATAGQMIAGTTVAVTEGTLYADSLWMFATTGAIVVDTTPIGFAFVGPSFGADTRVSLPNSAAAMVEALKLITSFSDDTAGAERSQIEFYTLFGGAQGPALIVETSPGGLQIGKYLIFINDPDTGITNPGADNISFVAGGVNLLAMTSNTLTMAAATVLTWGAGAATLSRDGGDGTLKAVPDTASGNVQLGLLSLANTATHGFPCIPANAGAPTGVVTPPAGMVALYVNTSNGHLYWSAGGGTWVDSSV